MRKPQLLLFVAGAFSLALVLAACSKESRPRLVKPNTRPVASKTIAFQYINMIDANNGWAMESTGGILRTNDGGKTWVDVTPIDYPVNNIHYTPGGHDFLNADSAWISLFKQNSREATLFHTVDGGKDWARITVPSEPKHGGTGSVQLLDFTSSAKGWLLVSYGVAMGHESAGLFRTVDGGKEWTYLADVSGTDITGMWFLNSGRGWITRSCNGPGLGLSWTQDGGATWKGQTLPVPADIPSLLSLDGGSSVYPPFFFSQDNGFVPVYFNTKDQPLVFYSTHDGGTHWNLTVPICPGGDRIVWSFANCRQGVVLDIGRDKLYTTQDGACQWIAVTPKGLKDENEVTQIDFVSPMVGWALAPDGVGLEKTQDGGKTWTVEPAQMPK